MKARWVMVVQYVGTSDDEKTVHSCPLCKSENQVKFAAEVNLHFRGLKNIDNPGVLFFPRIMVCLVCGVSQFSIPAAKLAMLKITEGTEKER